MTSCKQGCHRRIGTFRLDQYCACVASPGRLEEDRVVGCMIYIERISSLSSCAHLSAVAARGVSWSASVAIQQRHQDTPWLRHVCHGDIQCQVAMAKGGSRRL